MVYQRIRYFLKAAEEGSFVKAAQQMFVSSQGLTRQIKCLEDELGATLFTRSPRGVRLTSFGEEAYRMFAKIDADFTRAEEELKRLAVERKKRVNIGIFSALPQEKLVTPLISFFLAALSNYQIHINLVELAEGRRLLMEGKLDLLLTNTHEEDDWGDNRCYYMECHAAQVIVSLYHPWAMKDNITVEDMKKALFLKMQMDAEHYSVPQTESFYENIPCQDRHEVTNFQTLYALLQQGESFAVFPKAFSYMDQAKVKYFDYPGREFMFYTSLIYNPFSGRGALDAIVSELVEEFDMTER